MLQPLDAVKMEMVGRSMSGNSCSGSCRKLSAPNRQTSSTATPMAIGLRMEVAMSRISVSLAYSSAAI